MDNCAASQHSQEPRTTTITMPTIKQAVRRNSRFFARVASAIKMLGDVWCMLWSTGVIVYVMLFSPSSCSATGNDPFPTAPRLREAARVSGRPDYDCGDFACSDRSMTVICKGRVLVHSARWRRWHHVRSMCTWVCWLGVSPCRRRYARAGVPLLRWLHQHDCICTFFLLHPSPLPCYSSRSGPPSPPTLYARISPPQGRPLPPKRLRAVLLSERSFLLLLGACASFSEAKPTRVRTNSTRRASTPR